MDVSIDDIQQIFNLHNELGLFRILHNTVIARPFALLLIRYILYLRSLLIGLFLFLRLLRSSLFTSFCSVSCFWFAYLKVIYVFLSEFENVRFKRLMVMLWRLYLRFETSLRDL